MDASIYTCMVPASRKIVTQKRARPKKVNTPTESCQLKRLPVTGAEERLQAFLHLFSGRCLQVKAMLSFGVQDLCFGLEKFVIRFRTFCSARFWRRVARGSFKDLCARTNNPESPLKQSSSTCPFGSRYSTGMLSRNLN